MENYRVLWYDFIMTKTKSTIMMENSIRTKVYLAGLIEENKVSVPLDLWFDLAIILGKYTPIWLKPDMKDKNNVRMWNLLTHDSQEREYIGTGLDADEKP